MAKTATYGYTPDEGGFIVSEATGRRSREQIMLSALTAVARAGTVLGQAVNGGATSAAKAGGNTGNGTFVVDVTTPVLAAGKPGVYTARLTTTTNVRIEDPDGDVIADLAIGTSNGNSATVQEQIKGVITQGSTPFSVGDGFDITVAAGSGQYAPLSLAAINGGQLAKGILFGRREINVAAQRAAGMKRSCEVNGRLLVWPAGITTPQKAAAEAQLAELGILVRY